jgi:hypothetical protein
VLVGLFNLCGPGSGAGFNGGSSQVSSLVKLAAFLIAASEVSFFACVIWLVVTLIRRSSYE